MGRFTEKLRRSAVRTFPARLPPRPWASFRREAEEDPDLLRSPHEPSSESGEPPDPRPAPRAAASVTSGPAPLATRSGRKLQRIPALCGAQAEGELRAPAAA